MKFPAATAALSVSYARDLNQYSSTKHFNLSVNIPPPKGDTSRRWNLLLYTQ